MRKFFFNILIILSIVGLILPALAFSQEIEVKERPKMPPDLGDIWSFLKNIFEPLPRVLKGIWQEAVEIWQKIANWFKNLWNYNLLPKIKGTWHKILSLFGREVEERKEKIEEEIEKEKEEAKQEIKTETEKAGRSLWQRIKDTIPGI